MDKVLPLIDSAFGAAAGRLLLVLFVIYFLCEGFAQLWNTLREAADRKYLLSKELATLQALKLKCEILGLIKTHSLEGIKLPEPPLFQEKKKSSLSPTEYIVGFLVQRGHLGLVVVACLALALQTVSAIAAGFVFVFPLQTLDFEDSLGGGDFKIMAVSMSISIGVGLLGFVVCGRPLRRRVPRISTAITSVAILTACSLVIYSYGTRNLKESDKYREEFKKRPFRFFPKESDYRKRNTE